MAIARHLTQAQKDALEGLVDRTALDAVLRALRDIAEEKAQHIRENWQDEPAARAWEKAASQVGRASGHANVIDVSG